MMRECLLLLAAALFAGSAPVGDQPRINKPKIKMISFGDDLENKLWVKDIRKHDFDLEKWRLLRGEYFTLFLKEASEVIHAKGKRFSLGTARGDYIGFPLGNMKLEWRKWVTEKIIDELHLDERGWAWGRQGYGYLTDLDTGRGLRAIEDMVKEEYSPLCRKHGVQLYFRPALYGDKDLEWKRRVAAMPEFDGVID